MIFHGIYFDVYQLANVVQIFSSMVLGGCIIFWYIVVYIYELREIILKYGKDDRAQKERLYSFFFCCFVCCSCYFIFQFFFFLLDEKYSALHNYDQILIDFYSFNCRMTNAQVNICENGKCRKHFDWFSYAVYFHTEINFDIHGISFYIFITTPAVEVEIIEEKMSAFFGWIEN